MKRLSGLVLSLCLANFLSAQDMRMDTYCNPLNIDYTYMIYNSDKNISYRSGADPAVVSSGVNIICLLPVHMVIGVPEIC